MNSLIKYCGSIIRSSFTIVLLKLVGVFTFLMPETGIKVKQMLFIMTIVNELRRLSLFNNLTVEYVNQRLLRIKNPSVLLDIDDITHWGIIHLDLDQLEEHGIHLEHLMSNSFNERELYDFSKYIVEVTPATLRYNKTAMMSDLQRLLRRESFASHA